MSAILKFISTYEIWIYVVLGLAGLLYVRKIAGALQEWRAAAFGLEQDNAQRRLSEATSMLILLVLLGMSEFLLVTFVSPIYPGLQDLPTPTLDILATPIGAQPTVAASFSASASTGTPLPAALSTPTGNGCVSGKVELTSPKPGEEVKGNIDVKGVVNVPNFGFYKYELSQVGSDTWATIQAGDQPATTPDSVLGKWNTSLLVPGDYLLRLVVVDNQGQTLPPCIVPVHVAAP